MSGIPICEHCGAYEIDGYCEAGCQLYPFEPEELRQQQVDALDEELCDQATGYTTTLEIAPGGQQDGLDYGPLVVEIVVLDTGGATIAYQIASDSQDEGWQLGDTADAVDTLLDRRTIQEQADEVQDDF